MSRTTELMDAVLFPFFGEPCLSEAPLFRAAGTGAVRCDMGLRCDMGARWDIGVRVGAVPVKLSRDATLSRELDRDVRFSCDVTLSRLTRCLRPRVTSQDNVTSRQTVLYDNKADRAFP